MHLSYGLPTHRVDRGEEFLTAGAVGELSAAAEEAGFDAVFTTDHPFPSDRWLAGGGHHTLDPLVALSFAAAATTRVRLHTNLFVAAYRNPFLAAKGIATLDVLSGGRVILGVGVGYLEEEFEALGSPFGDRAERTDDAIVAMRQAWTGGTVERAGPGYRATGNTMLPCPVQRPGPPVWVGGNSRRAIRRAVELGDGWSPFPAGVGVAGATGTAALRTADDLARSLEYAAAHASAVGRTDPLTVVFVPEGLAMTDHGGMDEDRVVASIRELAAIGVDWVTVALPGDTRDAQLAALDRFTVVADAVAGD